MKFYEDTALLKRNKDGSTLLRTYYQRENHQMVKMLALILQSSEKIWEARDIIVSDLFEIFKTEEMLTSFKDFFENDYQSGLEIDDIFTSVKFQMRDISCEFLTTADEEQVYKVLDTQNCLREPRQLFVQECKDYDRLHDSDKYSIIPVLIDMEATETTIITEDFLEGQE